MILDAEPLSAANPETEADRRRALRALLRTPMLSAEGETAKDYSLVRRHSVWLKHWLARFPMWDLHLDKELARLRKTPPDLDDETRPAIDATSRTAFSRRRYALLCLALAALEKSERQTTLGKIARAIMDLVAADEELQAVGLVFDISNHDQRRDLVHAVRLLLDLGLLHRIHGDEQQFLNRSGALDALYEINRPLLAVMLNVAGSPSALEAAVKARRTGRAREASRSLDALQLGTNPDDEMSGPPMTDEARTRRVRARLVRILLDDPVLYFSDLSSDESAYLQRQRGYLLRQIREATGLIPELRREGIAMVDDAGDLTDLKLPEEGTDGHLALLLAAWVADHSRNCPGASIPISSVERHVRSLIQIHGAKWRKAVNEPGAESRLAEEALQRLRGLRLVRVTPEGVIPLAAVGRYAPEQSVDENDKQ